MSDEKVRAKRAESAVDGWVRIGDSFGRLRSKEEANDIAAAHNADADRMNAYAERIERELDEARRGLASRADKCCEKQKASLHAEVERLKRELANWRTRAEVAEGKLADSGLAQSFDAPAPPAPKALEALMWRLEHGLVWTRPGVAYSPTDWAASIVADANHAIRAAYALRKAEAAKDDGRKYELAFDNGPYWDRPVHLTKGTAEEVASAWNRAHGDIKPNAIDPMRTRPVEPKRWRLRIAGIPMGKSYETKAGAETEAGVLLRNWGIVGLVELVDGTEVGK